MLSQYELLARGVGVGLALVLAVGLLRQRPRSFGAAVSAALSGGIAVYLICSAQSVPCAASPWLFPLLVVAVANPFLFWWAARSVFEDGFRPRVRQIAMLFLLEALAVASRYEPASGLLPVLRIGSQAVALGLVGHALYLAARGWRNDLVEERRRFRGPYLLLIGGYVFVVLAVELWLHGRAPPAPLAALNVSGIAAILLLSCWWFLVAEPGRLEAFWPSQRPSPRVAVRPPADEERDTRALELLRTLLEDEHVYRDAELGIEPLARRVGVAEHRLRAIINGKLGQRNFAAFINGYRLDEAMRRLRDPGEISRPVLTIALEVGFGSIGPFNRAFKQRTGMTPSEYRSRAAARGATPERPHRG